MIDLKAAAQSKTAFLRTAYQHHKIAQAYLFVDPLQDRALSTAYWLACLFNCTGTQKPDGTCRNCRRILTGNHPDVLTLSTQGKESLSIDQIRPLKAELSKTPSEGETRFFMISQAERLTLSAANALLNLLEEPVAPVVTILMTPNADQILPTIRSRTQILTFSDLRLSDLDLHQQLLSFGLSPSEIDDLKGLQPLQQLVKSFYVAVLAHQDLALVVSHQIVNLVKSKAEGKYVFFLLKKWTSADFQTSGDLLARTRLLSLLMKVDQMRDSNVGLRSCLDALVLNF